MPDAEIIGRIVLAQLDAGRRVAHERARDKSKSLSALIRVYAEKDAAAGKPTWGRAGRIAMKLRGLTSRRTVAKYLATLDQSFQVVDARSHTHSSEDHQ